MILTTTNTIEGHKVHDYLGIVTGLALKVPSGSMTFSMKKYYANVGQEIEKIKEEAFQNLKENAVKLNANAVLGIKIDMEMTPAGITTVSIVGTAVKVA